MNTFDTLFSRRSIRKYNGEKLSEEELALILKAAYASPIGRARFDTLTLTVITDADFIARWEKRFGEHNGNENAHPFFGAPTVVLVSSVVNEAPLDNVNYSNAAIVVQNMAIAATELGIGSCHIWGAVRSLNISPDLLSELDIPEGQKPCCAITLGHTGEKYSLRDIPENKIKTFYK